MAKVSKGRYWAVVVYPESAPVDWIDRLKLTGLRCAVSPLHDKDIAPDGSDEAKKAHWHVLMCWDNTTTKNAAQAVSDGLCGVLMPQALNSVRGYYRYLTHQDDADKHQYDEKDIQFLNGFNPADYIEWTKSELEKLKLSVFDIVREADLCEYADLLDMLADSGRFDLWSVASSHTVLYRGYINSRRHRNERRT